MKKLDIPNLKRCWAAFALAVKGRPTPPPSSPEAAMIRSAANILVDVVEERVRQEILCAEGRFVATCAHEDGLDTAEKVAVLGEEFGEVCRAALEHEGLSNDVHGGDLRKELIQVAAVAVAWIEALDAEALAKKAKN